MPHNLQFIGIKKNIRYNHNKKIHKINDVLSLHNDFFPFFFCYFLPNVKLSKKYKIKERFKHTSHLLILQKYQFYPY